MGKPISRKNPYDLTEREVEIVSAVGRGLSIEEMAQQLRMSEEVVRHSLTSILDKTGLSTTSELAVFAKSQAIRKVARSEPKGADHG